MYEYKIASVKKIVDGDTIDVVVDLGFKIEMTMRVRLKEINTPELRGEEREAGLAAKKFVEEWFVHHDSCGCELRIKTDRDKKGKYGRYIGMIAAFFNPNELKPPANLNQDLLDNGHAVRVKY